MMAASSIVASQVAIASSDFKYTPNVAELSRIMTDSRFVGFVSPCTLNQNAVRSTPAEWIRTAFHDSGSYDASAGTGGLDGSIFFEKDRAENAGPAITSTLDQFKIFLQRGVSFADLIALGLTVAVESCGGPEIPFRAGRAQATSANVENTLPAPEEGFKAQFARFKRMGFSQEEMIALVACGHTLGGVHPAQNPKITNATVAGFDSTRHRFDSNVITEYLSNSFTNALANPANPFPGAQSDANIFNSDGNATVTAMSTPDAFNERCKKIFLKMTDEAIPKGTKLTDAIQHAKVSVGFKYNLRKGVFNVQTGSFSLYQYGSHNNVSLSIISRDGKSATPLPVDALSPLLNNKIEFGNFRTRTAIPVEVGISRIRAFVDETDGTTTEWLGTDGKGFDVEDRIIVDIGHSCRSGNAVNVTIAVLATTANPTVTLIYTQNDLTTLSTLPATRRGAWTAGYDYYEVIIQDTTALDGGLSFFEVEMKDGDKIIRNDNRGARWEVTGLLGGATGCVATTLPITSSAATTATVASTSTTIVTSSATPSSTTVLTTISSTVTTSFVTSGTSTSTAATSTSTSASFTTSTATSLSATESTTSVPKTSTAASTSTVYTPTSTSVASTSDKTSKLGYETPSNPTTATKKPTNILYSNSAKSVKAGLMVFAGCVVALI
ncbi:hypothetical protein HDU97_009937 [Phlyctochytrium planicorne]|nr:hypothetical protein HDU97_009937 [Phlyctochytrium planicorne]